MKYIAFATKSTKLTFGYDLSQGSSYDSDIIYSSNSSSNPFSVVSGMGFDLSEVENHSGQFVGDYSNITGHFADGYSSLGAHFDGKSYVEVKNKTLNDQVGGTFVFSHEKKSQGTEIIFSNYSSDPLDPKGFEFGINDANKLFFECQSSLGPKVFVLNNIPHKKNIYSVSVDAEVGEVVLSWWDTYEEVFDSQAFLVDASYLRPSSVWTIGSGRYQGEDSLDYSAGGYPSRGYIDKFFHFDEAVPVDDVTLIAKSFYEDLTYFPEVSGQYDSYITGYNQVVDEVVSGITGYEQIITGYSGQTTETYQYITGRNLYGTVNPGDYYYDFVTGVSPNGIISGDITGIYEELVADSISYEITGFETGYAVGTYTRGVNSPLYYYSGVSGERYTSYKDEPLFGDGGYYKISDSYYDLSGVVPIVLSDGLNGYGPRSYTYLGSREPSVDYIETQKGINMFSINNFAGISASDKSLNPQIFFNKSYTFDNDALSLSMNGVTKQKGEIDEVEYEDFTSSMEVTNGEFCVYDDGEDKDFYGKEILFSDENLSLYVDDPVVDILENGESQSLVVSDPSQYDDGPFSEIKPAGKNVFLNGQKIYESVDYEIVGDDFNPIGDIVSNQITGVFHTTNDWNYDEDAPSVSNVKGLGAYDIHESAPILLSSYASYLNGIRLDPKAFVYHDSDVDLIHQGKNFIGGKQYYEIYNNHDINRLGQDLASAGGVVVTGADFTILGTIDSDGTVIDEYGEPMPPGTLPIDTEPDEIVNLDIDTI